MTKYFTGVKTVEELRKRYRELLKKYHPDNENGSTKITQQINQEYDALFDRLKAQNKAEEHSSTHDVKEENKAFKEVLNQIIGFDMEIEIIGKWVWCFRCFAYKDRLKELNFNYAPKKKAWCWHYGDYRRYHKEEVSLDTIRAKYGSQKVNSQSKQYSLN